MTYYPGDLVRHNGLEYFMIIVPSTAADDSLPVGFEVTLADAEPNEPNHVVRLGLEDGTTLLDCG